MKKEQYCYQRLERYLQVYGISHMALARMSGIAYDTMRNKLRGKTSFKLEECERIRRLILPRGTIEDLFGKDGK